MLLVADIILTIATLCFVVLTGLRRTTPMVEARPGAGADLEEIRKRIEDLSGMEGDLAEKQKRLKDIIERLDEALSDLRPTVGAETTNEDGYSAARSLLQRGEPVEKVIRLCNLTRGEADVLASMNAMAS